MTSAVVAALSLLAAFVLATKNKTVAAVILSFIGALALMIAVPMLLSSETINVPHYVPWIVGITGLFVAAASKAMEKVPTAFMVLGIVLAVWGACRSFPTVPPAFENFGVNSQAALTASWSALKTLFTDLIPG